MPDFDPLRPRLEQSGSLLSTAPGFYRCRRAASVQLQTARSRRSGENQQPSAASDLDPTPRLAPPPGRGQGASRHSKLPAFRRRAAGPSGLRRGDAGRAARAAWRHSHRAAPKRRRTCAPRPPAPPAPLAHGGSSSASASRRQRCAGGCRAPRPDQREWTRARRPIHACCVPNRPLRNPLPRLCRHKRGHGAAAAGTGALGGTGPTALLHAESIRLRAG